MAFFAPHHPFQRRQAFGPSFPFGPGGAPTPAGQSPNNFHFYSAPPPLGPFGHDSFYRHQDTHQGVDYDAEERAALAHLRAIQQRREAAEAAAARESAIRAQAAAQRQAAIDRAIALEAQLQAEAHRARQTAFIERRRAQLEAYQQVQNATQARFAHGLQRREACARRCARKENKGEDEWKDMNNVLGAVFGFNVVPDTETKENKETEVKDSKETEAKSTETAPAKENVKDKEPVPENTTVPETKAATETKSAGEAQPAFPSEINNLLSHFLGLHVEPAGDNDQPTANAEASKEFTKNLNEFLRQFGLEFEPTTFGEPSDKTSAQSPAATTAPESSSTRTANADGKHASPLTSFLNERNNLPPFVRDILSNVEIAFNEGREEKSKAEPEVQGKGKGVAEGETTRRSAVPEAAPTPAESDTTTSSTASVDKLNDISHELRLVKESFTFPARLTFASSTDETAPRLLFNKTNSGYHAQAHALLQLLLAADGVSSGGDRDVRKKRKEVVKNVEGAIEELERKRDEVWSEVREKREKGEESEDEGSTTSYASSIADTEHIEHADVATVPGNESVEPTPQAAEAKGFDVPAEVNEGTEAAAENNQDVVVETPASAEAGVGEEKTEKIEEKNDGYELL